MGNVEEFGLVIPSQSRVMRWRSPISARRWRDSGCRRSGPFESRPGAAAWVAVGLDTDGRGEADAGAGVRAD